MTNADPPVDSPTRPQIVRAVLVFQVKLWLEGFKDVVLMPLSLGAALIDFVLGGSRAGAFKAVMRMGSRFERWVDLYAALDEPADEEHEIGARQAGGRESGRTERTAPSHPQEGRRYGVHSEPERAPAETRREGDPDGRRVRK